MWILALIQFPLVWNWNSEPNHNNSCDKVIYTLGKDPTVLERLPQKSDDPQRAALGLEKNPF